MTKSRREDVRLAKRLARGEADEWKLFFDETRDRAFSVAFGILSRRADAMDAVQTSFVKAVGAVAGFRGDSALTTWFLRIVTNTALDGLRRRAARPAMQADDVVFDATRAQSASPVQEAQADELADAVAQVVEALPEAQRVVFSLYTYGALSYAEIAEQVGISKGTVMSRLFYGREALREGLVERGFDVPESARRQDNEAV